MRPPYYHALIGALSHQDRNGLPNQDVGMEAETIRKICLETSEYKDDNRKKWEDFVATNPSDKAAKYMQGYL